VAGAGLFIGSNGVKHAAEPRWRVAGGWLRVGKLPVGSWQTLALPAVRQGGRGRIVERGSGLDILYTKWDIPTVIAVADQKRRVVLPKPVQPGDALDISVVGQRMILQILKKPTAVPFVAAQALEARDLAAIDLDQPAFLPLTDESPA